MDILPAIDILGGKAVRLAKGDYNAVTVYNDDPAAQAALFKEQGARWIHVVDLDGARSGVPENIDIIERIIKETGLKIEVGGGIRSLETIDRLAEAGVSRVVLGTTLVTDPEFAKAALAKYPDMLTAGIDAKNGEVAVVGAKAQAFPPKSLLPKWASLVSNTWCIPIFPVTACRRALMQLAMSKLRACSAILLLRRAV